MKLVIEALQRQIRLEEAAITANKIERDSRMNLPGWKGSPMHPERHEYLAELRKAIKILESPSDSEAVEFAEFVVSMCSHVPKSAAEIDVYIWTYAGKDYTTKELYQLFKSNPQP